MAHLALVVAEGLFVHIAWRQSQRKVENIRQSDDYDAFGRIVARSLVAVCPVGSIARRSALSAQDGDEVIPLNETIR